MSILPCQNRSSATGRHRVDYGQQLAARLLLRHARRKRQRVSSVFWFVEILYILVMIHVILSYQQ